MVNTQTIFNNLPKEASPFWNKQSRALDYQQIANDLFDVTDKKKKISEVTGVSKSSVRYDRKMPKEVRDFLNHTVTIFHMVYSYFNNDFEKTKLWFELPNPMIGENITPKDMIYIGRHQKLLQIVSAAVQGERP